MGNEKINKKQNYLPGTVRERIQDLLKGNNFTQAELSKRIGITESTLSRFISGKTDKLGDESIIKIANVFNVSTDFLLGVVNEPDRKNYDIAELGLSAEAAKNLYTGKVNSDVLNRLLVNPNFAEATYLISRYLNEDIAKGMAAQNQLYDSVAALLGYSGKDVMSLKTPVYQIDTASIQRKFMTAVKEIKKEYGSNTELSEKLEKSVFDKMLYELTKGKDIKTCNVTLDDIAETVANCVSGVGETSKENKERIKELFKTLAGGDCNETA